MQCQVCNDQTSKYKCPSCLTAYCSLDCWKSHKAGKCEVQNTPVNGQTVCTESLTLPHYSYTTEDTVPIEKLQLLESSESVRRLLQNPHFRKMLAAIDGSAEPGEAIRAAMSDPTFVQFVDECLKVVEPPEASQP